MARSHNEQKGSCADKRCEHQQLGGQNLVDKDLFGQILRPLGPWLVGLGGSPAGSL